MRPLEGFAGMRVKLGSHQFPFLMKVQQGKEGVWGERNCPPFSRASFLYFLVEKEGVCSQCHRCAEAADPIPAFPFPSLIKVVQPKSHGTTSPAYV